MKLVLLAFLVSCGAPPDPYTYFVGGFKCKELVLDKMSVPILKGCTLSEDPSKKEVTIINPNNILSL